MIADRFGANDVHLWNGKFVLQLSPKSLIRSTQDRMMDNDVQSVSIPEDLEIKILYPPNNEEKIDVSNLINVFKLVIEFKKKKKKKAYEIKIWYF